MGCLFDLCLLETCFLKFSLEILWFAGLCGAFHVRRLEKIDLKFKKKTQELAGHGRQHTGSVDI